MILVFDFSQENVYEPIHMLSALAIGCCMVGSAWPRVASVWEILGSKVAVLESTSCFGPTEKGYNSSLV